MMQRFDKYNIGQDVHWRETFSRSIFKYNAALAAQYKIIEDFLEDPKGKKVLDIGAGDCALAYLVARRGAEVVAIDNSPEGLKIGQGHFKKLGLGAEFLLADAYQIPLKDQIADIVISSHVIEHLGQPSEHLKEISRLLRPGGVLILSTPYRLGENYSPYHVKEFYPSEIVQLLEKDFEKIQIKETHHILWYALYNWRGKFMRWPLAKYLINIVALWFGKNPFLKDNSTRYKRDYFTQIVCRAFKKF